MRPGFAADEKMNKSSRANSPATPNFIIRKKNDIHMNIEGSIQMSNGGRAFLDHYSGVSLSELHGQG